MSFTDEELYAHISAASPAAFKTLYDRHSGPLFRFIMRFTTNAQNAEEILQDIFTQVLEGQFRNGEGANLKSWMYTLARNKSLNHLKKISREIKDDDGALNIEDSSDLEAQSIHLNLLQQLKLAEVSLPGDLQQTWNLRKQGLDYQQIAKELSVPVGTIKSRFHRLVEHLKKEFKQ